MNQLKRVYVYQKTVNEIQEWVKHQDFHTPNNKSNFPYELEMYIKYIKGFSG